jgi:hypothetical protein
MTFVLWIRAAALAAAALSLTACAAVQVGPDHPGTRVTYKSPDQQKWVGERKISGLSVFRCRPLACPEKSLVSIRVSQSPTRSPDVQALQRYAKEEADRQKVATEQAFSDSGGRLQDLTLLSSRVATDKGFPAVVWDYRGIIQDKPLYFVREMVFAGNSLIAVTSLSPSLEVAKRNSSDFVAMIKVEDFAPPSR